MRQGLIGLAASLVIGLPTIADEQPPNILLVMTDDQGWGDIRAHGNPLIETPTLDLLAGQGARFDRFLVSPVCAPTRASLLTGRYHLRTGTAWVTGGLEAMRASEVTIAEVLKEAGYATGCFGKWHNGAQYPRHPNGQGFDTFVGFCGGHWNNYFDTILERNGEEFRTEGYITDALTNEAIQFIEEHQHEPFFCYIPYNTPHSPDQVPDQFFQKYKDRGSEDKLASVYGMVENIDQNLDRLLQTLEQLNLAENTIVLFLTDNGANSNRYDGFMRGQKGSVHEGGVRVPLFIRWPGKIAPGTTVSQLSAHIDLMPTILELTGVRTPESVSRKFDGVSLVPLLDGYEPEWPDRMIFTHQYRRPTGLSPAPGSVRSQRYRYVREGGTAQLYDMVSDPTESRNLAEELPSITEEFATAYDRWFDDVSSTGIGPFPIPVGHPQRDTTELPAQDARLSGSVRFWATAGWANDWITNWDDTDDRIDWEIEVIEPGDYDLILKYTCPEANLGAQVEGQVGDQKTQGTVLVAHDPEPIPSPDRLPRGRRNKDGHWTGEAFEKEWMTLKLGTLKLPQGEHQLTLRATEVPGLGVLDLKGVILRRIRIEP